MSASITAIVVSFADAAATTRALQSLLAQSLVPIELLVVDNDPAGATVNALADGPLSPSVRAIHPGVNLGYTGAVNLAAKQALGDWLFLLNPDATAVEDCLERLAEAAAEPDVALVGTQVLLPDGHVNAGENPISITGLSWSGRYGRPREYGPSRDAVSVSGAALLARRSTFVELGGLCPFFFMYFDDADLAWRLRMNGMRVRYCPAAIVVHDYEFAKGAHKWFYLERNRVWALVSNLELRTLLMLSPLLLATETAVLIAAFSGGWLAEKVRAWRSLLGQIPQLIKWRRSVQRARVVSDYTVLEMFSGAVETDLLDTHIPRSAIICMENYKRIVIGILRKAQRPSRRP